MTWVRLDDRFPRHPKVLQAGAEAAWLWACGLAYCNEHLTDGFIPTLQLGILYPFGTRAKHLATRLCEVGLWERIEGSSTGGSGDGFNVINFLKWNDSSEKVKEKQAKAKAAKESWRQKREPGNAFQNAPGNRSGIDSGMHSGRLPESLPLLSSPLLSSPPEGASAVAPPSVTKPDPKPAKAPRAKKPQPPDWTWEAWREAYKRRYGRPYTSDPGDATTLLRLARHAAETLPDAGPALLAHWFAAYLADSAPFLLDRCHALRHLESGLPAYGLPSPAPEPSVSVAAPEPRPELRSLLAPVAGQQSLSALTAGIGLGGHP